MMTSFQDECHSPDAWQHAGPLKPLDGLMRSAAVQSLEMLNLSANALEGADAKVLTSIKSMFILETMTCSNFHMKHALLWQLLHAQGQSNTLHSSFVAWSDLTIFPWLVSLGQCSCTDRNAEQGLGIPSACCPQPELQQDQWLTPYRWGRACHCWIIDAMLHALKWQQNVATVMVMSSFTKLQSPCNDWIAFHIPLVCRAVTCTGPNTLDFSSVSHPLLNVSLGSCSCKVHPAYGVCEQMLFVSWNIR